MSQKDTLAGALIAFGATLTGAMDDNPGFTPCGHPAQCVFAGLSAYADPSSTDAELLELTGTALRFIPHVAANHGADPKQPYDLSDAGEQSRALLDGLARLAPAGAEAVAADDYLDEVNVFFYRSLGAIYAGDEQDVAARLADLGRIAGLLGASA